MPFKARFPLVAQLYSRDFVWTSMEVEVMKMPNTKYGNYALPSVRNSETIEKLKQSLKKHSIMKHDNIAKELHVK